MLSIPDFTHAREQRLVELGQDIAHAAYLRGRFVLRSGAISNYYFDKYLFETKPNLLRRVASFLAELVPPGTDRLAGPELGGVALATAVSLELGLPFVIVRKEQKSYATTSQLEGELYTGDDGHGVPSFGAGTSPPRRRGPGLDRGDRPRRGRCRGHGRRRAPVLAAVPSLAAQPLTEC
jgi:hypothetical protein